MKIGVGGVAKNVSGIRLGVSGVAKKVIKGYIGDSSGKARIFWEDYPVDNDTVTGNNLMSVLSAVSVQDAWEKLHQRISNSGGVPNYSGLGLNDYLDITEGLREPINIAWNASYLNLRLIILGFDVYKGSQGNTLSHILWGFKHIPLTRAMHSSNSNSGGYPAMALKTYIDNNFLPAMIDAMGADYFYDVRRLVSTKGGSTVMQAKLWLPNAKEVFGSAEFGGDDPSPQKIIPLYSKDVTYRIKKFQNVADYWWDGTPLASHTAYFCGVDKDGTLLSEQTSRSIGVAPCFCQI